MISIKTITAIWLGATLCTAQTINISGVVQDPAGAGISGATVRLEKATISTTTGADGRFTLSGAMATKPGEKKHATSSTPIQFQNGKIAITLHETALVDVRIYDIGGRQTYNNKKTYGSGTHTIEAPVQAAGIYLYSISIGKESYTFKASPFGSFSTGKTAKGNGNYLAKQAKSAAVIADVIFVAKEGKLDYRDSIKTSDTTGIVVKMIPNAGNVTDADGNVYQSVQIGSQVWTVENLRVTKYNDGTAIPPVTDSTVWMNLVTPGYCYCNNSTVAANQQKWGALYNWYAVNTGKLAPSGWHVPTDAEWTALQNYLITNGYNWDGTKTGNKIAKSMAAKTDWISDTTAGSIGNDLSKNNASGFSALPSSYRYSIKVCIFPYQGFQGRWWSAKEYGATYAWSRYFERAGGSLGRYYDYKQFGESVRLLRN